MAQFSGSLVIRGNISASNGITGSLLGTAARSDQVYVLNYSGYDGNQRIAYVGGVNQHHSLRADTEFNFNPGQNRLIVPNATFSGNVKAQLISQSAQVTLMDTTGDLSGSRIIGDIQASSVEFDNILNKPSGIPSSSNAQLHLQVMDGYQETGSVRIGRNDGVGRYHEIKGYNTDSVGSWLGFNVHNGTVDSTTEVLRLQGDNKVWVPYLSASSGVTSSFLHVQNNASIRGRLALFHDRQASADSVLIGKGAGDTGFSSTEINFSENTMVGTNAGRYVSNRSNLNTFVGFHSAHTYDGAARSVMNTAVGYNSMYGLGSGSSGTLQGNTALGARSLNNPGEYNTGLGYDAFQTSNVIGNYNTAVGANAGRNLEAGSSNVYIGPSAGPSSVTNESKQLYIGSGSGTPLIQGDFGEETVTITGGLSATALTGSLAFSHILNAPISSSNPATPVLHIPNGSEDRGLVAIGNGILTSAISASNLPYGSVVIGERAGAGLNAGIIGSDNVVIGREAMENDGKLISSYLNLSVIIGAYAGFNSSGEENVVLGAQSYTSGSGHSNTIMGCWSGNGHDFYGTQNTILGHQAGGSSTYGVGIRGDSDRNTIVGASATVREGSNNVLIGFGAGSYTDFSNKLYIENGGDSPLIEGDFSTKYVKINDVLQLNQVSPLPTGAVGQLAVSGSNLFFHNGTSWSQIN